MSYSLLSGSEDTITPYPTNDKELPNNGYDDDDSETGLNINARTRNLHTHQARRRSCLTVLFQTAATLLIGSMLGFLCTWRFSDQNSRILHTPKEFAPQMPLTTIRFDNIKELFDPPSPSTDAYWDSLIPPGRGFVQIPNPENYDLQPGIPTEMGIDRYSVAMYHQLHCLAAIRRGYYQIPGSSPNHHNGHHARNQGSVLQSTHDKHTQHCFSYLAQSILCSADLTIEWAMAGPDGTRVGADGWDIPHHQCKDPVAVRGWMDLHRSLVVRNTTHIDE